MKDKMAVKFRMILWSGIGFRGHPARECSRISGDEKSGDEVDGGKEGFGQLVVAGGDAPKLFELVKEALDAVAAAVSSNASCRKVWVTLSPQGREALALTNQYKHQVWREVFMTLSPDERDQVLAGIRIQSEAWRRFTEEARP